MAANKRTAEAERQPMTQRIVEQVRELQPARVFVDALTQKLRGEMGTRVRRQRGHYVLDRVVELDDSRV